MPTEAEHLAKHTECRNLLNGPPVLATLSEPWAAVVAFYAAVHLVERLAAKDLQHHTKHAGIGSRNWYIQNHAQHNTIAADFMALYSASLVARYHPPAAFTAGYPAGTVQANLIDNCLAAIEVYVDGVFNPPGPPAPPLAAGS
jgi:phosphoribosylaminoimidazole (AIR) synthetase